MSWQNNNQHRKDQNLILQTLVDEPTSTITYIWKSEVGKERIDNAWQIMRVDETTGIEVAFADWSDDFDFVWDLRATYTYTIN